MPLWPFRRKRRNKSKRDETRSDKSEKGQTHSPSRTNTVASGPTTAASSAPGTRSATPPRQRRTLIKRNTSQPTEVESLRDLQPPPPISDIRHPRSSEDLTALPPSRGIQASPHLRPVSDQRQNVIANQRSTRPGATAPNLPNSQLQKRRTIDTVPVRRKSSKRRKNDPIREEEVRAMSQPTPIPKRPATFQIGTTPLRSSSKRKRSSIPNDYHRPASIISTNIEDSVHSSMSGISEQRTFIVHGLPAFSPRPQVRYSSSPQYGYGSGGLYGDAAVSRSNSRREKGPPVFTIEHLKKKKTVDELADELDAGGIRALMERDKRRSAKSKLQEEERIRRKLQRRADRQEREAARPSSAGVGERGDLAARRRQREGVGLGVAAAATPMSPGERGTKNTDEIEAIRAGRYLGEPKTEPLPTTNPFSDDAEVTAPHTEMEADAVPGAEAERDNGPFETPMETPMETPWEISTAQAIRMSQASMTMSPPASPVIPERSPDRVAHVPTGGLVKAESAPPSSNLRQISTADAPPPLPPIDTRQRRTSAGPRSATTSASPSPGRRAGAWSSFFRRSTKRSSVPDQPRPNASETSFTNTSRESMSRQPLPSHLQQQPNARRSSTPHRTQSKFREDLPELPLSPPDSRVQSPEVTTALAAGSAAARRRAKNSLGTIETAGSSPFEGEHERADSPTSLNHQARASSRLMSHQSLASVDSEGSWLSGKPRQHSKRFSEPLSDISGAGRGSGLGNHSYEDLGLADEDVVRNNQQFSKGRGTPDTGADTFEEDQATGGAPDARRKRPLSDDPANGMMLRSGSKRQPTLIHGNPAFRSREALNELAAQSAVIEQAEDETQSPISATSDSPTFGAEETQPGHKGAGVQEAVSVDLGRHHSRHISAGSAKLLHIPARSDSKRGSTSTQGGQPGTPTLPDTPASVQH